MPATTGSEASASRPTEERGVGEHTPADDADTQPDTGQGGDVRERLELLSFDASGPAQPDRQRRGSEHEDRQRQQVGAVLERQHDVSS